ncbi:MAG: type II secretion system F family protein [Puniceicoccaceae bacterium]
MLRALSHIAWFASSRERLRIPTNLIALYSKQLAALLKAGVPIVQALQILQRQHSKGAMNRIVTEQIHMLEHGQSFSASLRVWPRVFGPMYVGLIVAGERAGVLSSVLERLARYDSHRVRMYGRLRSAMVYPAVVLAASLSIVGAMLVWVVPQFEEMFSNMLQGARLPGMTQWVIDVSDGVSSHIGWGIAGLFFALPLVGFLLRVESFRERWDALVLALPVFGDLRKKTALARFCHCLATLLESAVPMLEALETASATLQNRVLEQSMHKLRKQVRDGRSIALCLERDERMPEAFAGMVHVGETTGSLASMLTEIAQLFETEVEERLDHLLTLLEPALILLLAFSIGFLVIALFLPMVELMQNLGI